MSTSNTMDVTKEIKYRLKTISILLKEIEDILSGQEAESETEMLEDYSCICVCGQEPNTDVLKVKLDHNRDDHGKNVEMKCTMPTSFEKRVKYKGLERKRNTFDNVNDIDSYTQKNCTRNHEKGNKLHQDRMCKNTANKQVNNLSKHCSNENFKRKLSDIRQRFMAQFEEINKDETNDCC